jgi:hypothetical protein
MTQTPAEILAEGERLSSTRAARVLAATQGGRASVEFSQTAKYLDKIITALISTGTYVDPVSYPNLHRAVHDYRRNHLR